MPSAALTQRVERAWTTVRDPRWADRTRLIGIEGGSLTIGVSSSALRQELAQFHRDRLLGVLRAALPDTPLVGIRFTLISDSSGTRAPEDGSHGHD
jgi:hypothetical protein